jgi:tetratricopeptide (TPR) repeat protein
MDECKELRTYVYTDAREDRSDISSSKDTCDVKLKTNSTIQSARRRNARLLQNFILVWLDSSIDEVNDKNYRDIITKLQQVVNAVETFADADECIDFITDLKEEKIFLILSETMVQTIVSVVDEIPEVSSIYIFSEGRTQHKEWVEQQRKIRGVFTDISSMCEELKKTIQDCDHNSVSISFAKNSDGALNRSLDTLDSSFMYTQILKEILLTIDFDQGHFEEFLSYCRERFAGSDAELKNVDMIEKKYSHRQPIWWYTYQGFLYSMLNTSLRLMKIDLIIKMGFFVRDLHNHIVALHAEQYSKKSHSNSFIVYRGQGLSQIDFDQLKNTQGGLLAFNSFLSTSLDRDVSLLYAESMATSDNLVGVLFILEIDLSVSATPFANVTNASCYQEEEEILFSMHCVFRIGQVKQIEESTNLWQVQLTLTSDNDPQLQALTEYMRGEFFPDETGWHRLGSFLLKVAQYDKAQQVFEMILDRTTDESEKENIYHMLGIAKFNNGEYAESITFYEKSIEIMQKILPPTHPDLASSYGNLGAVYNKIGEYSKAYLYQEKALKTYQNIVSSNHLTFSVSSDNDDLLNERSDNSTRSISSFEKAIEILEKTLPRNDLSLVTYYDRCGSLWEKMGDNVKALSFYHRAFRIKKIHLPSNHPSFADSYAHLGAAYEKLEKSSEINPFQQWAFCTGECPICEKVANPSTAHSLHQLAFDIAERSLPADHPDRQTYKERIVNKP